MFKYVPNRFYLNLIPEGKDYEPRLEDVTKKTEKRKHELMLEKLLQLEEKIEYFENEEDPDSTEKLTAYEYDLRKLNAMVKEQKADNYTFMLAVEKILNSLGIENYRLYLIRVEKEIEQNLNEDDEKVDEEQEEIQEECYMNMYKYDGEFYAINITTDIRKKNMNLSNGDVVFKDLLQIPIDQIIDIYNTMVCKKPKNNGEFYCDLEFVELIKFLYKNQKQERNYYKEIVTVQTKTQKYLSF